MKKNAHKGSALSQYGIVIALVALLLIPVLIILGKNIVGSFDSLYKGLLGQKSSEVSGTNTQAAPSNDIVVPGNLGGSPDKPVQSCENGVCTIDFGDYVLTGIPESMQDFFKNAGSSGVTDKISDLLIQIASQMESEGLTNEANDIKKLANLGHSFAAIEKTYEDLQKTCNFDKDCITDQMKIMEKNDPEEINSINNIELLAIKELYLTDPGLPKEQGWPKDGISFIETYFNIIQNDSLNDSTKAIVDVLATNIMILGNEFHEYTHFTDERVYELNQTLQDFKTSETTNLNSALICATGSGTDVNNNCK